MAECVQGIIYVCKFCVYALLTRPYLSHAKYVSTQNKSTFCRWFHEGYGTCLCAVTLILMIGLLQAHVRAFSEFFHTLPTQ